MDINPTNIYPVSQARAMFSKLINEVINFKKIFLTKKGRIKAVLVNFEYFQKIERDLKRFYKKTFIDEKLLPYTRIFSNKEIRQWEKEDKL